MNLEKLLKDPALLMPLAEKGILVVLIVIASIIVYRSTIFALGMLKKKNIMPAIAIEFSRKFLKVIFIVFTFIFCLQAAGFSVGSVYAVLSTLLAMFAVGFIAVWSTVSNVLCALLLVITRPFRIGDIIEITEPHSSANWLAGKVVNLSLLYTTLAEVVREEGSDDNLSYRERNARIMVPNNIFFQKAIRRVDGEKTYELDEQLMVKESLVENT